MIQVPENKTVYIGARKFVEGEILPPFIRLEIPVMTRKEAEEKAEEIELKPKRKYKTRSGVIL